MYWVLPWECSHPKGGIIRSTIDRWSDLIGQDRDGRHLGTLSTILQHLTHTINPATHCCSPMSLCAATALSMYIIRLTRISQTGWYDPMFYYYQVVLNQMDRFRCGRFVVLQGVVQETQEVQNYQEFVFMDLRGLRDQQDVWINDTDRTMSGCCHVSK